MEQILKHVSPQNKEWVESLSSEQIGALFNALSLVPQMTTSIINEDKFSDKPSVRGLQGEDMFESMLNEFMPSDYTCENVAKSGKMGDFILTHMSHKTNKQYKILVDIKNYKSTVPSKELDKFYRDLNINHVQGGFMLSLHSKIVGKSKTIVFDTFSTDRGSVPTLLAYTNTPLVIVELIKLMFHIIEIKDITYNSISRKRELVSNINQLNDHIGLITSCRDIIATTRGVMEKSLDQVMMKLMTCEYTFIAKITQINNGLTDDELHNTVPNKMLGPADQILSNKIEEVLETEFKEHVNDDINQHNHTTDPVNVIAIKFGGSFVLGDEHLLRSIYNTHKWNDLKIITSKNEWHLNDNIQHIVIKFAKKSIKIIFIELTDGHNIIINTRVSKGKTTARGYAIILNESNIEFILELLNVHI
jgi:hypothetical protein